VPVVRLVGNADDFSLTEATGYSAPRWPSAHRGRPIRWKELAPVRACSACRCPQARRRRARLAWHRRLAHRGRQGVRADPAWSTLNDRACCPASAGRQRLRRCSAAARRRGEMILTAAIASRRTRCPWSRPPPLSDANRERHEIGVPTVASRAPCCFHELRPRRRDGFRHRRPAAAGSCLTRTPSRRWVVPSNAALAAFRSSTSLWRGRLAWPTCPAGGGGACGLADGGPSPRALVSR